MAHTTHHTPWEQSALHRHDLPRHDWRTKNTHADPPAVANAPAGAGDAHRWHITTTLRYPATERDRTDRRPIPEHVTRSYASYSYARAWGGTERDEWCTVLERGERARVNGQLRAAATAAQTLLGSGEHDELDWDEAVFDIAPTRHRNSARWNAV